MRQVYKFILVLLKNIIHDLLYRLKLKTPHLHDGDGAACDNFININKHQWNKPEIERSTGRILLEGHLSQYGLNYLYRTAIAGKSLQEDNNLGIEVVFHGYSYQWEQARRVYASFGIENFTYLSTASPLSNIFYAVISILYSLTFIVRTRTAKEIVDIKFGDIKVGDLIYDDIIKRGPSKTIDNIDQKVILSIARSFFYFLQYRRLFSSKKYHFYVATHTQYSQFGLLCRVALSQGVKVIETTDIQMSFYDVISPTELPTYHQGISNRIKIELKSKKDNLGVLREQALSALEDRMACKIDQIDVRKAYVGTIYDKFSLRKKLKISNDFPLVFVFAHVCSDAPHASSAMLYADYYKWLKSTVCIAGNAEKVNWIFKPHPSADIYGEDNLVAALIDEYDFPNLYVCPNDLNVASVASCADAIVTVHGTAGLEFSCLGIPVLLAGKPFYSGFGFTFEPETEKEYEYALHAIDSLPQLTTKQINNAIEVYALWHNQFDWENPIITSETLSYVWGSGRKRDPIKVYKLIAQNIQSADPRELPLWHFTQGIKSKI